MKNYLNAINPFKAPQLERVRADQIQNNAGGFVFAVSDEQRFLRFLILGTEGGTYYVNERAQTKLEGYRLLIAGSLVRIQPAPPVVLAFGFYFCEAVAEWLNATVVREHQPSSATCSILKLEPID